MRTRSRSTGFWEFLIVVLLCACSFSLDAATITVTSVADSGAGTLRATLASAANGDLIVFSLTLPATITLTTGELLITNNVTILGPGPSNLAINGNAADRVFEIGTGRSVAIAGLTITNGNFAGGDGGGIYNPATLTVSNCVLSGNSAQHGGAIFNDAVIGGAATLTVGASTITGNLATNGGGIFNSVVQHGDIGRISVYRSTFSSNVGNGIYNLGLSAGAFLDITNSTFSGNTGGVCIFNLGRNLGGGIVNVSASTFSGNSDGDIYNSANGPGSQGGVGQINLTASTFSGNSASGSIFNVSLGQLFIGDSILDAGATGVSISNASASVFSYGYNLCSDGGAGFLTNSTDQINTDPMLGPLADNGGPTLTHALLPGSPATDQGKNLAGSPIDQRGLPRPVDDPCIANASGGDGSDIGALEMQPVCLPVEFRITNIMPAGNNMRLSYTTMLGSNYVVQTRFDLSSGSWTNLPGTNVGIGVVMQTVVSNALAVPRAFYRIQQLP